MFQHGISPRSRSPDLETLPHIDLPHRHAQHDSDSDDDDRDRSERIQQQRGEDSDDVDVEGTQRGAYAEAVTERQKLMGQAAMKKLRWAEKVVRGAILCWHEKDSEAAVVRSNTYETASAQRTIRENFSRGQHFDACMCPARSVRTCTRNISKMT